MNDKEMLIRMFKVSLNWTQVDHIPAEGQFVNTGDALITGSGIHFMIDSVGKCRDINAQLEDIQ